MKPFLLFTILFAAVALWAGPPSAKMQCSIHPAKGTKSAELAKLAKITQDEAQKLALAALPDAKGASVAEAELEVEKGCLMWSFDIKIEGKSGVQEVQIDAGDGKVLVSENETPKAEAGEKAQDKQYHLLKPIPVGGEGGWDYISIDSAARRLYVAHSTFIEAIDLAKGAVAGRVEGLNGSHGFAVAPELGLGFASSGRDSKAAIVDLKTLKVLSWVATGENPDAILYASTTKEVYTFNGRAKSATVFDAKSGKVTAIIPLPGKPEFAVFDPQAGMIYNNIEDKSVIVAIDAKTHAVVSTWPIAPGEEASGLAIDLKHHHLFIVCDNKLMVLMDAATGKVLSSAPIGAGVDAAAFDPETGLAFSSNGEGNVTILRENPAGTLTVVQTLATARSARTMILDPATHRIYLPAADLEPQPEQKPGEPRQRPKVVSGSFRILVAAAE